MKEYKNSIQELVTAIQKLELSTLNSIMDNETQQLLDSLNIGDETKILESTNNLKNNLEKQVLFLLII